MNKYIIPICIIQDSKVYNLIIYANSYSNCLDKIMNKFSKYSDSDDWDQFLKDLDKKDILIGKIQDIEEL